MVLFHVGLYYSDVEFNKSSLTMAETLTSQ